MRVTVRRTGGFAGLSTATTLDSERLAPAAQQVLRARVDGVRPFAAPPAHGPGPDRFSYEMTVEDGGRSDTLRCPEADLTPGLRDLVALVLSAPERERQVTRPGAAR